MQKFSTIIQSRAGRLKAGLRIVVDPYAPGALPNLTATSGATIYAIDGGPAVPSVLTDADGRFSFYAADGHYNITVTGVGIVPYMLPDVTLNDPNDEVELTNRVDLLDVLHRGVSNVKDPRFAGGATGGGISDDTAAIQAAMNMGGRVYFPPGRYIVSAPLIRSTTGLIIEGAGIDATVIEPSAGFAGNSVFVLGTKFAADECRQISMRNMMIDLKGRVDAGIEMYGLRDGSSFESIYIWKIRKYGIRTGWANAGNNAPFTMNEGLKFDNVHILSRNEGGSVSNGAYFDLSGLYESVLLNCKALGYDASGATHTNMDGFRIGGVATAGLGDADCQGVRLYNCAAGNFIGSGNRAFFFGNAFDCNADVPTSENVQGVAFAFGQANTTGNLSDKYSASRCFVNAPRLYNPAADALVHVTKFEFSGSARQCAARNVPFFSASAGQKMARFLASSGLCNVDILAGDTDPAAASGFIDFTSADPSNVVRAYTNGTATKRQATFAKDQLFTERTTNGTVIQHTQFYTTYNLAADLRYCTAAGVQIMTLKASGAVVLNTAVLPSSPVGDPGTVWRDAAAGGTLKSI